MSLENFSLHPHNQVLAGLTDTEGNICGEEVLKRVINSEIFILLGEPAIGKSTNTDQIANELSERNIPYEIVAYDDVLDEYVKTRRTHKEGLELNTLLVQKVLEARARMVTVGGVTIFDTCAVGKKTPKDRSVTAVEELVRMAQEGNALFSKISILSIIGALSAQYRRAYMRYDIMVTPSKLLVAHLRDVHHTIIEDVPSDTSDLELAKGIKNIIRRTARLEHIVTISREVINEDLKLMLQRNFLDMYKIFVPAFFHGSDIFPIQLKAAGMQQRARRLALSKDQWLTVINPEQEGPITWYAEKFLRRDSN